MTDITWKNNNTLSKLKEHNFDAVFQHKVKEMVKKLKNNDFEVLGVRPVSIDNGAGEAEIKCKIFGEEKPLTVDWYSKGGWDYPGYSRFYFNYYFTGSRESCYRFWFEDETSDEVKAQENLCDKIREYLKDHPEIKK